MMWFKETNKEAGVVSLFTAIFFTILLTVLTTGFIRIMINENQQANDDDFSSRAYYAAESGVEDMKRALAQYYPSDTAKLNAAICDPPVGYSNVVSAALGISYPCKLLNFNPPSIEATLPGDGSTLQWRLRSQNDASFNAIRISWHSLSDTVDGANVAFRTTNTIPTYGAWNNGGTPFPAMIRSQIFGYTTAGPVNEADLKANNYAGFLNPTSTANGNSIDISGALNGATTPTNVLCTANTTTYGGYACQTTINITSIGSFSGKTMFLRLKSLFDTNGTKVKIELMNGSNVVNTSDAQAIVDVTGRAGTLFRRVQSRVSLPGTASSDLMPEFGLESGDNICKRIELTDTTETLNGCVVR